MRCHAALGVPLPRVLRTAAEFDVNMQLRRLLENDDLPLAEIGDLLREARDERVLLDETTLMTIERTVERMAAKVMQQPDAIDLLERFEALVSLVRESQVKVSLRKPQNEYYRMRKTIRPVIAASAGNGSSSASRWLQHFDALGEKLSISPEASG